MRMLTKGQKFFPYRGAKIWDSLSAESKQANLSVCIVSRKLFRNRHFFFCFHCKFLKMIYITFNILKIRFQ